MKACLIFQSVVFPPLLEVQLMFVNTAALKGHQQEDLHGEDTISRTWKLFNQDSKLLSL